MADIEARMETRVRVGGQDAERVTGNMVYAWFVHRETRPINGMPDPHFHIHAYVFNATFDGEEKRWKAGQFMNLKADAPFYEAAFNARLASNLIAAGYPIRRTDRSFELASVTRALIEKFSKRTIEIEELARREYTVLTARARALVKETGMEFADAFAQVKSELGAKSRKSKSEAKLSAQEQLSNWRSQMTPEERASLQSANVKGARSQHLLEPVLAKVLAVNHLFERSSVVRELHAAGMLLRRGIGRISVDQAKIFASQDTRFVRPYAGARVMTTREVLYSGQRLGDLARLTWASVDLQREIITFVTRKTGRTIVCPICELLMEHIITSCPTKVSSGAPLHPRSYRKPINVLSKQFADLLRATGLRQPLVRTGEHGRGRRNVSELSFHCLRITAVSLLKDAGIPQAVVEELIGHESAKMSALYTRVGQIALAKATSALPAL